MIFEQAEATKANHQQAVVKVRTEQKPPKVDKEVTTTSPRRRSDFTVIARDESSFTDERWQGK
jgi:hypothetical protein